MYSALKFDEGWCSHEGILSPCERQQGGNQMRRRTAERRERGGVGEKKTRPLLHHLGSSAFSVSKKILM